ncbi:MAG: hypothetical protein IH936_13710 [Acidobacteria bacterium]|nr:hypothetical protein [Acidobacteriota bacterium]
MLICRDFGRDRVDDAELVGNDPTDLLDQLGSLFDVAALMIMLSTSDLASERTGAVETCT